MSYNYFIKYLLIISFIFTTCKSKKKIIDAKKVKMSHDIEKILNDFNSKNISDKYIHIKNKIHYKTEKQNRKLSVDIKIKKDEVILITIYAMLFTVAKTKITPNKFSFCNFYEKTFLDGDFKLIHKLIGISLNFQSIQSILLGKNILPINSQNYKLEISKDKYKLSYIGNEFKHDLSLNPLTYIIEKELLVDKKLHIYKEVTPKKIKNNYFPKQIDLNIKTEQMINVKMIYSDISIEKNLKFDYKIPNGYKQIFL